MNRRCLVVDDHAGFRAAARRLLESEGWIVVGEAADGAAALMAAASLRPDMVLLDIGLPDIDGFEVAEGLAGSPVDVVLALEPRRGGVRQSRRGQPGGRLHRQGRSRWRDPPRASWLRGRPMARHVRRRRSVLLLIGVAALAFGPIATYQLTLTAPRSAALLLADIGVGWSMIAAGLLICDRRPGNRIGPLAVATGFVWFAGDFTSAGNAGVAYVATVFHGWFDPLFAILILAYPTGRLLRPWIAGWRSGSSSSRQAGRSPRPTRFARSPGGSARPASTRSTHRSAPSRRWTRSGGSRPSR